MYSFIPTVMVSGITSVPTGYGALLLKKSAIPNRVPTNLLLGELAVNVADAKLYSINVSSVIQLLAQAAPLIITGGRLTFSSTITVPSWDIATTNATIIYYLPHTGPNITLYNSVSAQYELVPLPVSGYSIASLTANTNYDIFIVNNNNGTSSITVGTAWSGDNTRAVALYADSGMLFRGSGSSDHIARYVGLIRIRATGQGEDSGQYRYIWNHYNRVPRPLICYPSLWGYNWTVNPSSGWNFRPCNNSLTAARLEVVVDEVTAVVMRFSSLSQPNTAGADAANGISLNQTSGWAQSGNYGMNTDTTNILSCTSDCPTQLTNSGRNWWQGIDMLYAASGSATCTYWLLLLSAVVNM